MNIRHNYSVAPIVRCVDFHKVISGIGGAEIVLAMGHAMNTWYWKYFISQISGTWTLSFVQGLIYKAWVGPGDSVMNAIFVH